jgi:hypothetical protein
LGLGSISDGSKLPIFLRAESPKSLVLAGELFSGLWRGHAAQRGHDTLDMLRDLALREFARVTKAKQ